MKYLLYTFLLFSVSANAQWKSYTIHEKYGDTLNRIDNNNRKQGPWIDVTEATRSDVAYEEQGYYEDGLRTGKWLRFSTLGDKLAEENYRWGKLNGKSKYYTRAGILLREESWRAIDPKKKFDTVAVTDINDPTKVLKYVVVKVDNYSVRHGLWKYYDTDFGTVVKVEDYFMDKIKESNGLAAEDDDLAPINMGSAKKKSDTASAKTTAKPAAVINWEKSKTKKKNKSRDGQTGL